jgi:hypothetical protein
MSKFSVTQNGKELDKKFYNWNEESRTFSTNKNDLVLDFSLLNGITFDTGAYCIFKTGSNSTFDTGSSCIFKTCSSCTFDTGSNCTFTTGKECVVIRRDIFEVIKLEENKPIKLNSYKIEGFEYIKPEHIITIDGKEIKLSEESFNELKKQPKE